MWTWTWLCFECHNCAAKLAVGPFAVTMLATLRDEDALVGVTQSGRHILLAIGAQDAWRIAAAPVKCCAWEPIQNLLTEDVNGHGLMLLHRFTDEEMKQSDNDVRAVWVEPSECGATSDC